MVDHTYVKALTMSERTYAGRTLAELKALHAETPAIAARYSTALPIERVWNALPALIARIEELEAMVEKWRKAMIAHADALEAARRIVQTERLRGTGAFFEAVEQDALTIARALYEQAMKWAEEGTFVLAGAEAKDPKDDRPFTPPLYD